MLVYKFKIHSLIHERTCACNKYYLKNVEVGHPPQDHTNTKALSTMWEDMGNTHGGSDISTRMITEVSY